MNKCILVGRLTKDSELRSTNSGLSVSSFPIAINRTFKNKNGGYDTDFLSITLYGKQAENISKYLVKGTQVGIDGRIQTRNYENEEGKKVYVTEVIAENVELLGSKKETSNEVRQAEEVKEVDPFKEMTEQERFNQECDDLSDELPF